MSKYYKFYRDIKIFAKSESSKPASLFIFNNRLVTDCFQNKELFEYQINMNGVFDHIRKKNYFSLSLVSKPNHIVIN